MGGWDVSQLVRQSLQEERMAFVVRPPPFKPSGHSTALVPLQKADLRPLGGGGRGPYLINPFSSSPNWFSRQGLLNLSGGGGEDESRGCSEN